MHGGASGSGATIGNKNALRHGHYPAEAIARRPELAELIREHGSQPSFEKPLLKRANRFTEIRMVKFWRSK
jgi:hypothetical protein